MANDDAPLVRQFFRSSTPAWLKRRLLPFESELLAQATRFCREHQDGLILDVGCGREFHGSNTIGLDLQFESLHNSQRGVCGDAMELPFASDAFDFVLCNAALHHFKNPERALGEMRRVLRLSGELLLTVPDRFPPTTLSDDYYRFKRSSIVGLLEKAGWTVTKCTSIGGRFWTLSRHMLEWLFRWNRGPQLAVFAIAAPLAGVLLPLTCFYADSLVTHDSCTLGWSILAKKQRCICSGGL